MAREGSVTLKFGMDDTAFNAAAARVSARMAKVQRDGQKYLGTLNAAYAENARREEQAARAAEAAQRAHADAMGKVGQAAGAALGATSLVLEEGARASARAAIAWESAWTGVRKTVDGTPEQMAALQKELRGLTTVLPATHDEVAAVAEAAGQLGIKTGNVTSFTKVMLDMGNATNMSADQAATQLARFMNIMGTSQSQVSNLGSSIVALGNNFATTESEISNMAMRIAGAGRQAGLSEGQVFGLAAALSSVGIEAEAGGTAISTVMTKIGKAVDEGGDKFDMFARVAGMSTEAFAAAWRTDAAGALSAVVKGLSDTSAMGMSTNQVLDELGIKGIREADAMRRLSSSHEVLNAALALGAEAYEKNNALSDEAAKRYETAESKIQMAKSAIADLAIDVGSTLADAAGWGAERVMDLAAGIGQLPPAAKGAAGVIGAVFGVGGTALGGFLVLLPKIQQIKGALDVLRTTSPKVAAAIGGIGKAAGPIGAALAIVGGAVMLIGRNATESKERVEALKNTLTETGDVTDETRKAIVDAWGQRQSWTAGLDGVRDSALDLAKVLGYTTDQMLAMAEGTGEGQRMLAEIDAEIARLREGLADPANHDAYALRIERLKDFRGAILDQSDALQTSIADTQQMADAYEEAGLGAKDAAAGATAVGDAAADAADGVGDLTDATEEAEKAYKKWFESMAGAFESWRDNKGIYSDLTDQARKAAQAQADAWNDAHPDAKVKKSWEDFYDGISISANRWLESLKKQAEAQQKWAANVIEASAQVRKEMPKELHNAADAMIDELALRGPEGAAMLQAFLEADDATQAQIVATWAAMGGGAANAYVEAVEDVRNPSLTIEANGELVEVKRDELVAALNGAVGTITINGDPASGEAALEALTIQVNEADGTITLLGQDGQARTTLTDYQYAVDNTDGTVTLLGKDTEGREVLTKFVADITATEGTVTINAKPSKTWLEMGGIKGFLGITDTPTLSVGVGTVLAPGRGDGEGVAGTGSVRGYKQQQAVLPSLDPSAKVTSSYRPGAITATGNQSYHGMGRAIDIVSANMGATYQALKALYGANAKELYYSGPGGGFIRNGAPHKPAAVTIRDHYNHIHWAMASGGVVPGSPPADRRADNVLGVNEHGVPHVLVRSGEFVQPQESTDYYGLGVMEALRRRLIPRNVMGALLGRLPGFAAGGVVGKSISQLADEVIRGVYGNGQARKAALGDRYAQVQAEVNKRLGGGSPSAPPAPSAEDAEVAQEARKKAQAEAEARAKAAASLRLEISRGRVVEGATSGLSGAQSLSDRLRSMAQDSSLGLTVAQAKALTTQADAAEKSFTALYKQADDLAGKVKDARDKVAELASIKASAASVIAKGWSLAEAAKERAGDAYTTEVASQWGIATVSGADLIGPTGASMLAKAREYAARAKAFAAKLAALKAAGFGGAILQEVAAMGIESGGIAADALLELGKSDVSAMNAAYADIEKWANQAGEYVTGGFYNGGLAAAEGLVKGLESQESAIKKQIEKVATTMQDALKKALGIKSPSRVFRTLGQYTGEGMRLGLVDKQAAIAKAAAQMVAVPAAPPVPVAAVAARSIVPAPAAGATAPGGNVYSVGELHVHADLNTIDDIPKLVGAVSSLKRNARKYGG